MAAATASIAFVVVIVLRSGRFVLGTERVPAATAGHRVGVIDLEGTGEHVVLLVIDRGTAQIACAYWVDQNAQAVGVPLIITLAHFVVECHTILHTRATAARNEYPQPIVVQLFLFHHAEQTAGSRLGDGQSRRDHRGGPYANHVLLYN